PGVSGGRGQRGRSHRPRHLRAAGEEPDRPQHPARGEIRPRRGGHLRHRARGRHQLARLHPRAAGRLADAPAGGTARPAGRGYPPRTAPAAAADAHERTPVRAVGRVADAVAGDRRHGLRAPPDRPAPHPLGRPATRSPREGPAMTPTTINGQPPADTTPLLRTLSPALRGLERGLRSWFDAVHRYPLSTIGRAT